MSYMNPVTFRWVVGINPSLTNEQGLESMPYLLFAPHCEACGEPVERYEGVPVGTIYPYDTFLCQTCRDFVDGAYSFALRQLQSGAWSEEEAIAFLQRWEEWGV